MAVFVFNVLKNVETLAIILVRRETVRHGRQPRLAIVGVLLLLDMGEKHEEMKTRSLLGAQPMLE